MIDVIVKLYGIKTMQREEQAYEGLALNTKFEEEDGHGGKKVYYDFS